jgi:hypothetical protein
LSLIPTGKRPRIARGQVFPGHALKKLGPPDAMKYRRSRAVSLKYRSESWGFADRSERRGQASECAETGNEKPVLT